MEEKPINRVTINIMGEEYIIRGDGQPETMVQAAGYADEVMRSLAEKHRHLSDYKIAVLALINLADELFKLKRGYPRYENEEKVRDEEDELV